MHKIYWDSVKEGDVVFERISNALTNVQIAKFAGAFEDYSPLHLDIEFADLMGYRGVIAHEMLLYGFAHETLQTSLKNVRIISHTQTFHKLVRPGDLLKAIGTVKEKETADYGALIEVVVENHRHDVVMKGTAQCLLFKSASEEKKHRSHVPALSANARKNCLAMIPKIKVKG